MRHRFAGLSVTHADKACVQHLMAVAAGLESQIFGDDQILTQVRDAAALAREAQTTDSVLDTLFRRAVTAGKRVRTEVRLTGVPRLRGGGRRAAGAGLFRHAARPPRGGHRQR